MDLEDIWDMKLEIIGGNLRDLADRSNLVESDCLCFDGAYETKMEATVDLSVGDSIKVETCAWPFEPCCGHVANHA